MLAYRVEGLGGESPEVAELWELGCVGVQETPTGVLAYFEERQELPYGGVWEAVSDRDYLAEYQATLHAVRVGPVVIAPQHRVAELTDGELVVWLDPGAAFGTGHHETTHMALAGVVRAEPRGRTVLDVGTGTGVLAIAADALGARSVYGVDIDPDAVRVARENGARNRSRARFGVGGVDLATLPGRFDLVVANLYAELHVALFGQYAQRALPGGRVLLTGILASKQGMVTAAAPPELRLERVDEMGEWVLLEYART